MLPRGPGQRRGQLWRSSILAFGATPGGGDWEIGFAATQGVDGPGLGFSLRDASVSTSGAALGAASTIDPRTGNVASPRRLVSVVSRCPVEAEVVSTALLARPTERRGSCNSIGRYGRWSFSSNAAAAV
ncbi:FAD:protein FMN transferase [Caulobacter segnis]